MMETKTRAVEWRVVCPGDFYVKEFGPNQFQRVISQGFGVYFEDVNKFVPAEELGFMVSTIRRYQKKG